MIQCPKVNDKIMHEVYGKGTVERVHRTEYGKTILVNFGKHGCKVLYWRFAKHKISKE